jgi:hypothetical protein
MSEQVRFVPERCTAYFRGRGLFVYHGRRCTLDAPHPGEQHSTPRNGVGAPFVFRWGRKK